MRLEGSLAKAQAIKPGQHAKARDLHYDIENELEHGLYDEGQADEAERALAHLEANHPGVREASRAVTRPPNLSRGAKQQIDAESDPAPASSSPAPSSSSSPGVPHRRGSSSSSRSSRRGGGVRAGRVFDRATGGHRGEFSDAVIGGLQLLFVAGLTYQVLQPRGSRAFAGILGGVGRGFRLIVDPVDPLGASPSRIEKGYADVQQQIAQAQANAPDRGQFDTPTGPAPFEPPSNLGGRAGLFNTPGGYAPYKPPPGIPVTPPAAAQPFPTNTPFRIPQLPSLAW